MRHPEHFGDNQLLISSCSFVKESSIKAPSSFTLFIKCY